MSKLCDKRKLETLLFKVELSCVVQKKRKQNTCIVDKADLYAVLKKIIQFQLDFKINNNKLFPNAQMTYNMCNLWAFQTSPETKR